MSKKEIASYHTLIDALYEKIAAIIEEARAKVATAVNLTMVYTNYEIGRHIVEDEQQGKTRAELASPFLKEYPKDLRRNLVMDTLSKLFRK